MKFIVMKDILELHITLTDRSRDDQEQARHSTYHVGNQVFNEDDLQKLRDHKMKINDNVRVRNFTSLLISNKLSIN